MKMEVLEEEEDEEEEVVVHSKGWVTQLEIEPSGFTSHKPPVCVKPPYKG